MKIAHAEFVVSAASATQFPKDRVPQIALCGRSNVGKSSLLNALLRRKDLARTSNTPGKTRQINFYRVQPEGHSVRPFYFVDLPGYGYAKVSQSERESWRELIENFFTQCAALAGALSIIDIRRGAMESDMELLTWLASIHMPTVLVATKADKLSNKQRADMMREIKTATANIPLLNALMFSSEEVVGFKELWQLVIALLRAYKEKERT
jgi:GTP-binding protein